MQDHHKPHENPPPPKPELPVWRATGGYAPSKSSRLKAFVIVAILHVVIFYAFIKYGIITVSERHPLPPLVVELVPLPKPSSPERPEVKRLPTRPAKVAPQRIPAPVPIVVAPTAPTMSVAETPPQPSPPVAQAAPDPAPSAPVAANLATRLVSATPPRYPLESRHSHESGTVVLSVLLSEDGSVEFVTVSQSSGFERLDRAALGAVRKWRWSPTVVDGRRVRVQGFVRIPFELRG